MLNWQDNKELKKLVRFVDVATVNNHYRPMLNSMLWESEKRKLTASDGYRMHRVTIPTNFDVSEYVTYTDYHHVVPNKRSFRQVDQPVFSGRMPDYDAIEESVINKKTVLSFKVWANDLKDFLENTTDEYLAFGYTWQDYILVQPNNQYAPASPLKIHSAVYEDELRLHWGFNRSYLRDIVKFTYKKNNPIVTIQIHDEPESSFNGTVIMSGHFWEHGELHQFIIMGADGNNPR